MKKYLSILTLAAAFTSLSFASVAPKTMGAVMSWSLTEYDFGRIERNVPVQANFKFENTGNAPLVIVSAKGSCGCTVAEYSQGEILPGEYGEVRATYNAAKAGVFSKTVTVNANTDSGPIVLTVKGEVLD
ncbi:DUF1573 domain-containing protein [Reichenbachiella carrageenanivorans]|uniref:DUF1573 domain-containing protein n=1 Tax=Reichenbachiella carrageenanivorans TaxID=2979869 RepID=A0ABY6D1S6_9BACT|nr:DUF1573 domain-containing protein [Reichenbachiella carrageenanivorans]UXX80112.1 DUF1573 domain-containing protein [Reichenbachiella carrageenanivorans]